MSIGCLCALIGVRSLGGYSVRITAMMTDCNVLVVMSSNACFHSIVGPSLA